MFKLTVAQVDKVLFQDDVARVTCPGGLGDVTILSHHAPLVTQLRAGELRIVDTQGVATQFPVTDGILEVGGNEATVLL
jgi:F-type H+-transporting ATPase subunit epsilon